MYCSWCKANVKTVADDGKTFCGICGKVFEDQVFSEEPVFSKNAAGQSQLSGNFVNSCRSSNGESREALLNRVYEDLRYMKNGLNMGDSSDDLVTDAVRFYKMALEKNFTRGRRKECVEASCLYIACRTKNRPYLLIDFANYLMINVYVLGAVFLQLCQHLNLREHDIVQKPVDPSLFIFKYTYSLCGKNKEVEETALQIIASMKRDWMQTGRKPSGLCGAAIYISALSHGLKYSKTDIVRIVHICEATLTKRLVEFENTESGSLTIEEFMVKAKELQESNFQPNKPGSDEVVCKHKDRKNFACGLCEVCYTELIEISGGFEGGSDPPAFQRAERERKLKVSENSEKHGDLPDIPSTSENENVCCEQDRKNGSADKLRDLDTDGAAEPHGTDDATKESGDESDRFSDIDDVEVEGYLHSEEEKQYKKIIWEEMNREYLEEQAAKEAAAAAVREAFAANFQNCPEDLQAAQKIAAAAAAAGAKSKKERQQKRASEARNFVPPQNAAEATRQMLIKKRLSVKVNLELLGNLYVESLDSEKPSKKLHSENKESGINEKTHNSDEGVNGDLEQENEYIGQADDGETYDNDAYYESYDAYDYGDDGYGHDLY